MSSIANIKDSSFNIEANDNIKETYTPKKCRKLYVIIGVVAAAVVITAIVLLCVFLTRKKPEHIKLPKENIQNSKQGIQILIHGNNLSQRRRNLQENEEIIQILGKNFNELNSDNTIIYIDNKKVNFDKYISIGSNKTTKVEIKFLKDLTTFKEMFKGCKRLKEVTLQNINANLVAETTSMFEGCIGLSEVKFENITINKIQNTSKMFKECSNLNKIDIENFSTENTKDMLQMFEGCSSLDNASFIEGLSTKSSEIMTEIFSGCSKIQSLDLSGYNTSNVKDISGMFKNMTNLKQLDINNMDTKNVEI
jgi:surface protein